jgi:hypothetical protein
MAEDVTEPKQQFGAAAAAVAPPAKGDLSEEISKSLARKPDERIRVVRVFEDCYRCNWWVQDTAPHPFWLATGTIRKSRFVRAARTKDGGLKVEGGA